jgi:hypothetical protein
MLEIKHIKHVYASDLLMIYCLATLLFREMNVLHTHIELVVDVIKGTLAPSWLNLFFNGPKSVEHTDDILGARMLWKPKEARIL